MALSAFVRPDCADARPALLAGLVFARVPAVVENMAWCVWHRNVVRATAFSVGDWQEVSTHAGESQPAEVPRRPVRCFSHGAQGRAQAGSGDSEKEG
jgi:hypothetical protein